MIHPFLFSVSLCIALASFAVFWLAWDMAHPSLAFSETGNRQEALLISESEKILRICHVVLQSSRVTFWVSAILLSVVIISWLRRFLQGGHQPAPGKTTSTKPTLPISNVQQNLQPDVRQWLQQQNTSEYDEHEESTAVSTSDASDHTSAALHPSVSYNHTINLHSPVFNINSRAAREVLAGLLRGQDHVGRALEVDDEDTDGEETYVPDEEERREILEELDTLSHVIRPRNVSKCRLSSGDSLLWIIALCVLKNPAGFGSGVGLS